MVDETGGSYPPSPTDRLTGLPLLSSTYALRVAASIFAIILFFGLYFATIGACGWLVYLSFRFGFGRQGEGVALLLFAGRIIALTLIAFCLKFLFKPRVRTGQNRVELANEEAPALFAFIDELCSETATKRPRRVFLAPEPNAYVAYAKRGFFPFPRGKDLTIGLGLVEVLTLTEFKAVLAHEFGHFSQRSMRIGGLVGSVNQIIYDMIYTRDKWDEYLDSLKGARKGLSIIGIVLGLFVELIRGLLKSFYFLLNRLYASLSREMELAADKVAVSVSGSESIIRGLWKLEYASHFWHSTLRGVAAAAGQGAYTKNFFAHFASEWSRHGDELKTAFEELGRDASGHIVYFEPEPYLKAQGYNAHPSNARRELSAKEPFVAAASDDRSALTLFPEKETLAYKLTEIIYLHYFGVSCAAPTDQEAARTIIEASRDEAARLPPVSYARTVSDTMS